MINFTTVVYQFDHHGEHVIIRGVTDMPQIALINITKLLRIELKSI